MTTLWREKLAALSADLIFAPAASEEAVRDCERELGLELPQELREIVLESNGIKAQYGVGLVWPIVQISDTNRYFRSSEDFRELYMPFDPLLFFGDAGNGDQFAYAINDGLVRRDDIFAWIHEDDSRTWVAPSLDRYFEWWLEGRINL